MKVKIQVEQFNHLFTDKMKWYIDTCSILECIDEQYNTGDEVWEYDELGLWL